MGASVTPSPTQAAFDGTPLAPLDPFIVPSLRAPRPEYGFVPVDPLTLNLPSVGNFLPSTGNTQFGFPTPTPLPTLLPYPTSPPLLPEPEPTRFGLPTFAPFEAVGTVPYTLEEAAECAPEAFPVDGILTQRFTPSHPGIDIAVNLGTPVRATHSGQVIYAGWNDDGYGYLAIVRSGPFITYYGHNTSFNVTSGDFVGRGSILAWSGNTGNSSGPHVHYETRISDTPVDPFTFENRGFAGC